MGFFGDVAKQYAVPLVAGAAVGGLGVHIVEGPSPQPVQAIYRQALDGAVHHGLRTGQWRQGKLVMRIVTGNVAPIDNTSPNVERELLDSALAESNAAAGYIAGNDVPPRQEASVACGTALANDKTRHQLLHSNAPLEFADGLSDPTGSEAAREDFGDAAKTCGSIVMHALNTGYSVLVPVGSQQQS